MVLEGPDQGTGPAPIPRPLAPECRANRSAKVCDWLAGRDAEIEVFYLPGYSPDLNPDEGINGDLKQAYTSRGILLGATLLVYATMMLWRE